jgi:hypothetical protein
MWRSTTSGRLSRAFGAGFAAFIVASIVSNLLFFRLGAGLLFDPDAQSDKLLAVFFEMEPLPLMFTNGPLYLAIAGIIGGLHGLVFAWIAPALPGGRLKRGLAFGVVLWVLMAVFFEFHTPFNMFGEPVALVALELVFWGVVLAVEGLILSFLYGTSRVERED